MEVAVDPRRNLLRFTLGDTAGSGDGPELPVTIDVGEGGRLIGIEIPESFGLSFASWVAAGFGEEVDGSFYLPVSVPDHGTDAHARSADAMVTVRLMGAEIRAIELPRHGNGYEITYPSGNQ